MATIDTRIRLSDQEIEQIMLTHARCRIATVGPGTDINLTPMTFGWSQGRVYIFGRGQKVANLRRNPTATVLVDFGEAWRELTGIMMRGRAEVLETQAQEQQDPGLIGAMQNIGEKHALPESYQASAAGRSRRWIVFTPEHVVSWDNAKL